MNKKYLLIYGFFCGIVVSTNVNPNCGKCIEHAIETPHIIETQYFYNPVGLVYVTGISSSTVSASVAFLSGRNLFYYN